jgi:Cytochrome c554 and c-prime
MKKISIAIFISICIIVLSNCIEEPVQIDMRGKAYAGSQVCGQCHTEIVRSYQQTAHYNTTSEFISKLARSNFGPGFNTFRFNDSISVVMEEKDREYYQTYVRNGRKIFSHPFDITVGSGRKAQTYLYYNDKKKISQLPISFMTAENAWVNSPGFPARDARFDRNVPSYCLGCHSSYIEVKQTYQGPLMNEEFEKNKIIYGIDCERCHGPALEHVRHFTYNPKDTQDKHIVSIRGLNRIQKNDMCALCHSGFRDVQQSLFKFKPGDDINNFYVPDFRGADTDSLDVHGNQTQLMMASKCFQMSNDLTCNSCHNVHTTERDNMKIFSQRCMNCHQQVQHSFAAKSAELQNAVQNNCIDCHMPLKPSKAITMLTNQQRTLPDNIRTHLVTVYRKESKMWMDSLLKVLPKRVVSN